MILTKKTIVLTFSLVAFVVFGACLQAQPGKEQSKLESSSGKKSPGRNKVLAFLVPLPPRLQNSEPFHPFYKNEKLQKAMARGGEYLKKVQKADGSWKLNIAATGMPGGWTGLALLALLKSGVSKDDPAIQNGLLYLRTIKPKTTYVVALQTAVLVNGDPKKDRALIQRNVAWLLDPKGGNQFRGWSYQGQSARSDNSNTHFAVMALNEVQKSRIKIQPRVWREIQNYYLAGQIPNGGWGYTGFNPPANASFSMTVAGYSGIAISGQHLNNSQNIANPLVRAEQEIARSFRIDLPQRTFYSLFALARAGRLSGNRFFPANPKHDWFQEGADYLLQNQKDNGSWERQGAWDKWGVVSTSFALLFFAEGK